jgi:integral membrane protein
MTSATARPQPKGLAGSLTFYRVMAFVTGVVLLAGTIGLILQAFGDDDSLKTTMRWLWTAHGYLYLVYLIATLNLASKTRWPLARIVLVALAGTIPTMSFVAEHFTTRYVRERMAAPAGTTASATESGRPTTSGQ